MNFKKIKDDSARERQLMKSLQIWEDRLKSKPDDPKLKKMVEVRQAQLDEYRNGDRSAGSSKESGVPSLNEEEKVEKQVEKIVREVPSVRNSKELYAFAEELGIDYKQANGKPKSTDWIKSEIAKVLWKEQYPNKEMPIQISPMLINDITGEGKEYVDKTFKKDKWSLQHKLNGQRLILAIDPDGTTHMTSRDRSVKTFRYSELDNHVLGLLDLESPFSGLTVLDGEVMCEEANIKLPSGVETTSTLQSTVALIHMNAKDSIEYQRKNGFSLRYKVFDILYLDGKDVQNEPYRVRKDLTVTACQAIKTLNPDCAIDIVPTIDDYDSAWEVFQDYVSKGGEGLILKNLDAKYEQGKRTKGQWKLKARLTIDAFVTGYVPASEDKSLSDYIGGLVFSTNYKGKEIEIAAVSNIDMATRRDATIYVEGKPTLNPKFIGKCAELVGQNFKEGSMRLGSARINEWRDDKNPEDCVLLEEQIRYDR